jgi:serine/threonine protein kinase
MEYVCVYVCCMYMYICASCLCFELYKKLNLMLLPFFQVLQHKKIDMSEEEMAAFARSSLEAIAFLHDLGRVHRDIKVTHAPLPCLCVRTRLLSCTLRVYVCMYMLADMHTDQAYV